MTCLKCGSPVRDIELNGPKSYWIHLLPQFSWECGKAEVEEA